jgi:UDP-GlcNAc:undecaprenyl-phosphate GlcNAc-1-phosphate transferase
VVVLYGVSAAFALLSLFLLWPTGSSLGLVLAVLGTGIWVGVQRLGYLELGELARVAQRTFGQRTIVINNLAIRRAAEELKVARDYDQILRILEAAFASNDFDGFDLRFTLFPGESYPLDVTDPSPQRRRPEGFFHWGKNGGSRSIEDLAVWTLSLDLVSSSDRYRGALILHRSSQRNLEFDINLLTSAFPIVLADALERTLHTNQVIPRDGKDDAGFVAAQAG